MYYGWALEAQIVRRRAPSRASAPSCCCRWRRRSAWPGAPHDAHRDHVAPARARAAAAACTTSSCARRACAGRRSRWRWCPDALARSALEAVLEQMPERAERDARQRAVAAGVHSALQQRPRAQQGAERARARAGARAARQARRCSRRCARGCSRSADPDDIERGLAGRRPHARAEATGRAAWHSRRRAHRALHRVHACRADRRSRRGAARRWPRRVGDRHWPEATFFCERLLAQRRFLDGRFDEADQRWKTLHARGGARRRFVRRHVLQRAYASTSRSSARAPKAVRRSARSLAATPLATLTPYTRAGMARIAAEAGELELAREQLSALGDPERLPARRPLPAPAGEPRGVRQPRSTTSRAASSCSRCSRRTPSSTRRARWATTSARSRISSGCSPLALGRDRAQATYFERALELNQAMGYRAGVVRTLLAHARLEKRLGHARVGRELLTRARDEARAAGMNGRARRMRRGAAAPSSSCFASRDRRREVERRGSTLKCNTKRRQPKCRRPPNLPLTRRNSRARSTAW